MSAAPGFWTAPAWQLRECYNGIGPERWARRWRRWVTRELRRFEPSALAHDWEFSCAPRTYLHFTIANTRFFVNSVLEAWETRVPWLAWHGFWLALVCQLFGWGGFKATPVRWFERAK